VIIAAGKIVRFSKRGRGGRGHFGVRVLGTYEVLTKQKFLLFKPQADFIAVDGGKPFLSDVPSFRTGHLRPF
jgi:hypothetical protein